jgi:hypothetical protein
MSSNLGYSTIAFTEEDAKNPEKIAELILSETTVDITEAHKAEALSLANLLVALHESFIEGKDVDALVSTIVTINLSNSLGLELIAPMIPLSEIGEDKFLEIVARVRTNTMLSQQFLKAQYRDIFYSFLQDFCTTQSGFSLDSVSRHGLDSITLNTPFDILGLPIKAILTVIKKGEHEECLISIFPRYDSSFPENLEDVSKAMLNRKIANLEDLDATKLAEQIGKLVPILEQGILV